MTIQDINKALVEAMKAKNTVAKLLFQTLKGAVENELKNGARTDAQVEELIRNTAKKFTENAKIMGTPDALVEIELLKPFMPAQLSESDYAALAMGVVGSNAATVEEIKSGKNPNKIGMLLGSFMKESKTKFPGVSADPVLAKHAVEQALLTV